MHISTKLIDHSLKSKHQLLVEAFMLSAKHKLPQSLTWPSRDNRRLLANLLLEEAIETIDALGFDVSHDTETNQLYVEDDPNSNDEGNYRKVAEVVDGCLDSRYVATFILSSLGVPDEPFQDIVDTNNLQKFKPGHSFRDDGKLIKPVDHVPPNIIGKLLELL